jgi:hypothetical protein
MAKRTDNSGTKRKMPVGRPFPKGVSGNPGGQPKGVMEVRELARKWAPQAIATLAAIMTDESQPGPARCLAANSLLDRGYGKPQLHAQSELTVHHQIDSMSAAELRSYIAAETRKLRIFEIEAKAFDRDDSELLALPSPE